MLKKKKIFRTNEIVEKRVTYTNNSLDQFMDFLCQQIHIEIGSFYSPATKTKTSS